MAAMVQLWEKRNQGMEPTCRGDQQLGWLVFVVYLDNTEKKPILLFATILWDMSEPLSLGGLLNNLLALWCTLLKLFASCLRFFVHFFPTDFAITPSLWSESSTMLTSSYSATTPYILAAEAVCEHRDREKDGGISIKRSLSATISSDPIRMSIIIIKLVLKKPRALEPNRVI